MTTLTIEQGNNIEVVPNAVIQKLYETALNSTNVTLSGNLQCEHCYEDAYNYLTGYITEGVKRFPNLAINVTDSAYIRFADPVVKSVLIANNGYSPDGVGVTLNTARSITSMNKSLFNKNEEITSFDELEKFENLTSLGPGARSGYSEALFYNCINLQSIKLPSSIRVIGNECFYKCSSLTAIQGDLSNIEAVGEGSFGFSGITNIDLSESKITSVDLAVFRDCLNLTSVKLPPGEVSAIRKLAFYHCDNLESITGLSGTVTVYSGAFNRCSKLPQSFFLPLTFKLDSAGSDGTFYRCYLLTSINLSDDTYTIPSNCFDTCTGLTTIDTSHITQINGSAFINCTNLQNVDLSNVEYIGQKAFLGCSSIDTVDLSNIQRLGVQAFDGSGLTGIINLPSIVNFVNGNNYINADGRTFLNCKDITEVNLGPNLLNFGLWDIFSGCTKLLTVTGLSSFTDIPSSTFRSCTTLSSVDLNFQSLTSIGGGAFYNCKNLSSLETINMPNLTDGRDYLLDCFFGCTLIKHVVNLGSITKLKSKYGNDGAFSNCTGLLDAVLPETLTEIGLAIFSSCSNMRYVKIMATNLVTYDLLDGFGNTYTYGSSFGENWRNGDVTNEYLGRTYPVYVKDELLSQYQVADGWKYLGPNRLRPLSQFATDFPNG